MSDAEAGTAVLSAEERETCEALLRSASAPGARITRVSLLWNRDQVVRLTTSEGVSFILKRVTGGLPPGATRDWFGIELASLEFLASTGSEVQPRLVGADVDKGVILMEDLPVGRSLADSLLGADREVAAADLVAYARALAAMHRASLGAVDVFEDLRRRYAPRADPRSWWQQRFNTGRDTAHGLAKVFGVSGMNADVDHVATALASDPYRGLVHGDPCPDNVRIVDGSCRVFDFETAAPANIALDAAYLLAPFPSCWCFAQLPADLLNTALNAYEQSLAAHGVSLGDAWTASLAAALACVLVGYTNRLPADVVGLRAWGDQRDRSRLLAWTQATARACADSGEFPAIKELASTLHETLSEAWRAERLLRYPAFGGTPATTPPVPPGWRPGL